MPGSPAFAGPSWLSTSRREHHGGQAVFVSPAAAVDDARRWTLGQAHLAQVKRARREIRRHVGVGRQSQRPEEEIMTAVGLPHDVTFAGLVELVFDGLLTVVVDDTNVNVRRHYFITSNARLVDEARW